MAINHSNLPARAVRRRSRDAGFSLVEILVAIVILTVGIVAFLQLFPLGFFSLQIASNTSNADRIAQGELSRLTDNGGSGARIQQIAAVTAYYTDNGVDEVVLDPNFQVDRALTSRSGLSLAQTTGFNLPEPATGAALPAGATALPTESYEYVAGEVVNVPGPQPITGVAAAQQANPAATTTLVSNSLVDFGPILLPAYGNAAYAYPSLATFNSLDPAQHAAFFVHGTPWSGKVGASGAVTANLQGAATAVAQDDPDVELAPDAPEYLIDASNMALALRQPSATATSAPYAQRFVFQVQVREPVNMNSATYVVVPKTVMFEADWGTANPAADQPANVITSNYDTSYHKSLWFSLAGAKCTDGTTLPAQGQGSFVAGSDKLVRDYDMVTQFSSDPYEFELAPGTDLTNNGGAGDQAYLGQVNFNPLAGRIVDSRGKPLAAAVDYIVQDWHTIHEDRTIGTQSNVGNASASGSSTVRLTLNDILRDNARTDANTTYTGIAGSGQAVYVYDLDTYQPLTEGTDYTVDYANGAVTFGNLYAGTHVRVYYHPAETWGVAVIKPAASYDVVTSAVNGGDTPTMTGEAVLDGNQLYFPVADTGRMVEIGGTVTYTTAAGVATSYTVPSELVDLATAGTDPSGSAPHASLGNAQLAGGAPAGSTVTADGLNVNGASVTVRVIWRQRGHWHSRDATTVASAGMASGGA